MLTALDPLALSHIIANMRDWDRQEIFATRADDDEDSFLADVMRAGQTSWIAWHEVEPVAAFGCMPLWNGVWSMWLFATDSFPKVGLSVTKTVIRDIVPKLWEGGAHRLECRSMEGHVEAQRWLELLGAKREGTHRSYGRAGEDFHVYTWERVHVLS